MYATHATSSFLLDLLFYLAFSTLLAHELDAVHEHEWRLLYVLRTMPDESARRAFVLLHVPIIAILLWLAAYPSEMVQFWTKTSLDLFMIVHAGLHRRLSERPQYKLHAAHSRFLIYGAAALAPLHLALLWLS